MCGGRLYLRPKSLLPQYHRQNLRSPHPLVLHHLLQQPQSFQQRQRVVFLQVSQLRRQTGPKAERIPDRLTGDGPGPDTRPVFAGPQRMEPPALPAPSPAAVSSQANDAGSNNMPPKASTTLQVPSSANAGPMTTSTPSISTVPAKSPPQGPAPKPRPPPVAPQAALRANASPSVSRAQLSQYAPIDASPNALPTTLGPRSSSGNATLISTSPKSLPANIPTGPKARQNANSISTASNVPSIGQAQLSCSKSANGWRPQEYAMGAARAYC